MNYWDFYISRKLFAIIFLFVCFGRLLQTWHNMTPNIFLTHIVCCNNVFIVSCNNPHINRGPIGNIIHRRQCSVNIQSSSLCVGSSANVHKLSRVHVPVGGRQASGWLLRYATDDASRTPCTKLTCNRQTRQWFITN